MGWQVRRLLLGVLVTLDIALGVGLFAAARREPGSPLGTHAETVLPTAVASPTPELQRQSGESTNVPAVLAAATGAEPSAPVLAAATSGPSSTPSPSATARLIPEHSRVDGVHGHRQSLPLDCESRSAADWAAYFGVGVDELDFFRRLPRSDDPEAGFVGDGQGEWGQIPPRPYGVHAGPVALLLRAFGLPAVSHEGLTLDDLRREIAAGRPVIVWVAGHLGLGTPVPYTTASGHTTIVTPREHTVILVGYTANTMTVVDGARTYTRSLADFRLSWSALGNMAVLLDRGSGQAVPGGLNATPVRGRPVE